MLPVPVLAFAMVETIYTESDMSLARSQSGLSGSSGEARESNVAKTILGLTCRGHSRGGQLLYERVAECTSSARQTQGKGSGRTCFKPGVPTRIGWMCQSGLLAGSNPAALTSLLC